MLIFSRLSFYGGLIDGLNILPYSKAVEIHFNSSTSFWQEIIRLSTLLAIKLFKEL
jgi:hypothetical protein